MFPADNTPAKPAKDIRKANAKKKLAAQAAKDKVYFYFSTLFSCLTSTGLLGG